MTETNYITKNHWGISWSFGNCLLYFEIFETTRSSLKILPFVERFVYTKYLLLNDMVTRYPCVSSNSVFFLGCGSWAFVIHSSNVHRHVFRLILCPESLLQACLPYYEQLGGNKVNNDHKQSYLDEKVDVGRLHVLHTSFNYVPGVLC